MSNSIEIIRGKTFSQVLRWETGPIMYKPITSITQAAPVVITATSHGLVSGWRAAVVSVKGMRQINASSPPRAGEYHQVTVLSSDSVSINDINAADYTAYASGGYLQYNTPVDLTGYTARMTIKDKIGGTVLASYTSSPEAGLVIDNVAKTITRTISATDTAGFTWDTGVCELEMVSSGGVVTSLGGIMDVIVSDEVAT